MRKGWLDGWATEVAIIRPEKLAMLKMRRETWAGRLGEYSSVEINSDVNAIAGGAGKITEICSLPPVQPAI